MHNNLFKTDTALDLELFILLEIPFIITHNELDIITLCALRQRINIAYGRLKKVHLPEPQYRIEGYPERRHHAGCVHADEMESLAVSRCKDLFKAAYANVQPHSGTGITVPQYVVLETKGISPN